MMPEYVPILNAKQGEFDAISNLPKSVHSKLLPIFELPRFTNSLRTSKKYRDLDNPIQAFISDRMNKIADVQSSQPVILDMFKWSPDSTLENGEHILSYATNLLNLRGTPIIPVIGYDRWEDPIYSKAIESLSGHVNSFCIRLDSYAFGDMLEEEYFLEQLDELLETYSLDPSQCNILLDFDEVHSKTIPDIQDNVERSLDLLEDYGFSFFSLAGCSLTQVINDMVAEADSCEKVLRREMVAWQAIRKSKPSVKLIYGDYGVVNPNIPDDMIAPDANGKIRYTIKDHYYIARGHSRRKGNKGEQMYDLAEMIINSGHYMGAKFSWGDLKIDECSNKLLKGNPTNWISFDTSHHTHAVLSEIFEFERTSIKAKLTSVS